MEAAGQRKSPPGTPTVQFGSVASHTPSACISPAAKQLLHAPPNSLPPTHLCTAQHLLHHYFLPLATKHLNHRQCYYTEPRCNTHLCATQYLLHRLLLPLALLLGQLAQLGAHRPPLVAVLAAHCGLWEFVAKRSACPAKTKGGAARSAPPAAHRGPCGSLHQVGQGCA